MPCRFTITEKWKEKWFRKLSIEARMLLGYLNDNCDIAGFLEVDFERIVFDTGLSLKEDGLLNGFKTPYRPLGDAFEELKNTYIKVGDIIWIREFLYEQKNLPLNPESTFHKGILKIINSHNSFGERVLSEIKKIVEERGLGGPTGNSNSKGNSKGNSKEEEKKEFDEFRKIYLGTKRGLDIEFENFCKKHKNWREILPLLKPAIEKQITQRELLTSKKVFVPEWKHLKTWINNNGWEEELATINKQPVDHKKTTEDRLRKTYSNYIKNANEVKLQDLYIHEPQYRFLICELRPDFQAGKVIV